MELIKTLALVGVSAGAGAWLGDKAFSYVEPKLPATVTAGGRTGAKLGFQAAGAVTVFMVLKSVF
jgi:ApbE superfamily uncharacterized protein (UPF0280 family)